MHLIFGGVSHGIGILTSVELYNWKTGEQCRMADLPVPITGPSATVLNGNPVFCGGITTGAYNGTTHCFSLNKELAVWESVRTQSFYHTYLILKRHISIISQVNFFYLIIIIILFF